MTLFGVTVTVTASWPGHSMTEFLRSQFALIGTWPTVSANGLFSRTAFNSGGLLLKLGSLLVVPAVIAMVVIFLQLEGRFVWGGVRWRWQRMSISNMTNRLSATQWVGEALRTPLAIIVTCVALALCSSSALSVVLVYAQTGIHTATLWLLSIIRAALLWICTIWTVFGAIDLMELRHNFWRQAHMTREERDDEHRESTRSNTRRFSQASPNTPGTGLADMDHRLVAVTAPSVWVLVSVSADGRCANVIRKRRDEPTGEDLGTLLTVESTSLAQRLLRMRVAKLAPALLADLITAMKQRPYPHDAN
jgi:hypothetical protein